MGTIVRVSPTGRVNLPARLRRQIGLEDGGAVLVSVDEGEIRLQTVRGAVSRLQEQARRIFAGSEETVDRLLADRREDARREQA
jgi:AbrB family looped-hinge helix DNA binding protein